MRAFWTWAQPQRFWFRESGLGPRHAQFVKSVPLYVPVKSLSGIWLWQAPLSMEFSRQEYWSECFPLLQGLFLTEGSNPHLLCFLRWQASSLPPVPPVNPSLCSQLENHWFKLEWGWEVGVMSALAHPSLGFGSYDFEKGDLLGHKPNYTLGQKCGTCLIPMKASLHNFLNVHGRASH